LICTNMVRDIECKATVPAINRRGFNKKSDKRCLMASIASLVVNFITASRG
jgi:hypothetical protein